MTFRYSVKRKGKPGPAHLGVTLNLRFTDTRGVEILSPQLAEEILRGLMAASESMGRSMGLKPSWSSTRLAFKARVP